jgi:hypothetical protein
MNKKNFGYIFIILIVLYVGISSEIENFDYIADKIGSIYL